MVFYFSGHVKVVQQYNQTQKTDLNGYGGTVRFYREKGRFLWKIKMK